MVSISLHVGDNARNKQIIQIKNRDDGSGNKQDLDKIRLNTYNMWSKLHNCFT